MTGAAVSAHRSVPVLEIGGTHVTAARVTLGRVPTIDESHRLALASGGAADDILERLLEAAATVAPDRPVPWGVAIPGPFDYEAGTGRFAGVGKFDSLNGYPLGQVLVERLGSSARSVRFVNDADAFGIGEHAAGAARGHERAVCLTLGTGIGSAFIADGLPVNDGPEVPPDGSAHRLEWRGRPLEDTVSRRALRAGYADATGQRLDVHEIAERARQGDATATRVFDDALRALGLAIGPWVHRFHATVLVVGGSIAGSWDLVATPLVAGLTDAGAGGVVVPAEHPHDAPLFGAASWAVGPA
jgi:glucokinase